MSRLYLDTSVYLGILLGEEEARPFPKVLERKILCASVLLLIEAERNLVRMSREGALEPAFFGLAMEQLKRDKESFLIRELTIDLCLTGSFPPVRIPRSNDLAHLRTAKWFLENGGLDGFLTLDKHQRDAAIEIGLPVLT